MALPTPVPELEPEPEAERIEIVSSQLPWDGSDLGVFQAGDLILERETLDGEEFWKLDSGEHCVARRCLPGRSLLPCLVLPCRKPIEKYP